MTNGQPHGINPGVLLVELIMSADRIISSADLAAEPDRDSWNASTLLGHLLQVDKEVWMARIQKILSPSYLDENPQGMTVAWWEPDPVATRNTYHSAKKSEVAADFLAGRTALLMLLRGLTPEQWSLPWNHDVKGALTLTDLILWILEHDEEHRSSLLDLVESARKN